MKTAYIEIEERLVRTIAVPVPDDTNLNSEEVQNAMDDARDKYHAGEIVLDSDDFVGQADIRARFDDGTVTEWDKV